MIWRCPNCHAAFDETASGWRCHNGHSFDRARQGYVNLLLPNQKNSSDPGDNRDMVAGRRSFLEGGHYLPLVNAMAALLQGHVETHLEGQAAGQDLTLLDLGCGEGYYLRALSSLLPANGSLSIYGLDISREAVKRAANSLPLASICIASSYRAPVADASVDVAVQVFAPVAEEEMQRILAPSGVWLRVSPGPRHLWQLKTALYSQVREHRVPEVAQGFHLLAQEQCRFPVSLSDKASIAQLLAMTPFSWHGSREGRQALLELEEFTVDADFVVELMRRN